MRLIENPSALLADIAMLFECLKHPVLIETSIS